MEVHGMAWAPWKAPFCGVPAGVQQDTSGVSLAAVITPPLAPSICTKATGKYRSSLRTPSAAGSRSAHCGHKRGKSPHPVRNRAHSAKWHAQV